MPQCPKPPPSSTYGTLRIDVYVRYPHLSPSRLLCLNLDPISDPSHFRLFLDLALHINLTTGPPLTHVIQKASSRASVSPYHSHTPFPFYFPSSSESFPLYLFAAPWVLLPLVRLPHLAPFSCLRTPSISTVAWLRRLYQPHTIPDHTTTLKLYKTLDRPRQPAIIR